jgi:hypothetical protein
MSVRRRLDCAQARLHASLALDGAVRDEERLRELWDHLGACPGCARHVASLGYATSLVRTAPLVSFRCELTSPRALRSRIDAQRGAWARAAVVLAAVVLGMSQFPTSTEAPGDPAPRAGRTAVLPLRLPIGQRSAADDFAVGRVPGTATGIGATGSS